MGIHRGEVLAGVMGNEDLSKFGVVGDAINVASRVERLTRDLSVDLLITEEVRGQLGDRFQLRAMPPVTVKGKTEPIVFVKKYGQGRVLQNVLGHGIDAKQNPNYQQLLRRGVEWAATGKVTE